MGEVVRFQERSRRRADSVPPEAYRDDDEQRERTAPPPHDLEAEAAVISAAMLDGSPHADGSTCAADRALELLRCEHFYYDPHARIWQGIDELRRASTPVDVITVRGWLDAKGWLTAVGGVVYLATLADATPAIGNVAAHADAVLSAWEDRQLLAAAQVTAAQARRPHEQEGGRDAWRARVREQLGAATRPRAAIVGAPSDDVVRRVRERADLAAREQVPAGVTWGFDALSDFGLVHQGRQEVITGRPGMGKTGFTFQLTRRIAEAPPLHDVGEAIYWWSGEMDPVDLITREAAASARVHYRLVAAGQMNAEQWERYGRALSAIGSLPIWWDHEPATPAQLAERVRRVKALFESGKAVRGNGKLYPRCRLRVVAIDQLSELLPPEDLSPRADERVKYGAIAKACRQQIAVRLNVATLLLAQLKRPDVPPSKVEPPALHDLSESGKIEQSADGVLALHRRQYYLRQRCPAEWKNVAEVLRLKGRYGEADDARLGFFAGRFSDWLPAAARGQPHFEGSDDEPWS